MNFYEEIMEKFAVEVDVKIQYLDEKRRTNNISKLNFDTLYTTWLFKPYLESYLHIDFKHGITIEFSCRYDGENWEWR